MQKERGLMKAIVIAGVALLLKTVAVRAETNSVATLLRMTDEGPDLGHSNVCLFVGDVLEVQVQNPSAGKQLQMPVEVTYHIRVRDEIFGRQLSEEILVSGMVGLQGSHVSQVDMPLYQTNALIVLAANHSRSNEYRFAGSGLLPIGATFPQQIEQDKTVRFMDAFNSLRTVAQKHRSGDGLSRQVGDWLKSSNDYVWALGVSVTAAWGYKNHWDEIRSQLNERSIPAVRNKWAQEVSQRFSVRPMGNQE